jgi:integrase
MISLFAPRLREFYASSVKSASHAGRTHEYYEDFLDCWERLTDNPRISKITEEAIWEFREAMLRAGYVSTTVNSKLRALRRILKLAAKRKWLTMPDVEMLREPEPDPRVADDEQLAAIYWACSIARWPIAIPLDSTKHRARAWECEDLNPVEYWRSKLVTIFNVGPRRNEFLKMRLVDVDFERSTLSLQSPKTGKWRQKPLHPAVLEHFQPIWGSGKRDLIYGKPKSGEQRYRQWREIQEHAGINQPFFDFQALRSTCGTGLFEQSPGAAQEMLGHSSLATTQRYYVKLSRHLKEVAATRKQPLPFYSGKTSLPSPTIKIG